MAVVSGSAGSALARPVFTVIFETVHAQTNEQWVPLPIKFWLTMFFLDPCRPHMQMQQIFVFRTCTGAPSYNSWQERIRMGG